MVLPKSPAEVLTRKQEGTEEAKVSKAGARGRISDLFKSNMYSSQPLTCNQKPREVLPYRFLQGCNTNENCVC